VMVAIIIVKGGQGPALRTVHLVLAGP
jgi:hypothetical protein